MPIFCRLSSHCQQMITDGKAVNKIEEHNGGTGGSASRKRARVKGCEVNGHKKLHCDSTLTRQRTHTNYLLVTRHGDSPTEFRNQSLNLFEFRLSSSTRSPSFDLAYATPLPIASTSCLLPTKSQLGTTLSSLGVWGVLCLTSHVDRHRRPSWKATLQRLIVTGGVDTATHKQS